MQYLYRYQSGRINIQKTALPSVVSYSLSFTFFLSLLPFEASVTSSAARYCMDPNSSGFSIEKTIFGQPHDQEVNKCLRKFTQKTQYL
jgi:hypothetical protein